MHLIVEGKRYSKKVKIEVTGKQHKEFLFNSKKDPTEKAILADELKKKPIFAGTYAPINAYEDANIYNVLTNYYFDDPPKVILAEDIRPIPYDNDEGVVY